MGLGLKIQRKLGKMNMAILFVVINA